MRDISELPEGTEQTQAKPATPKTRSAPRQKPENQATGSQEQETKPAPRRRSTATPTDAAAPATEQPQTTRTAPAPREGTDQPQAARPAPAPREGTDQPQAARPAPARREGTDQPQAARPAPARREGDQAPRPAPARRDGDQAPRPSTPYQGNRPYNGGGQGGYQGGGQGGYQSGGQGGYQGGQQRPGGYNRNPNQPSGPRPYGGPGQGGPRPAGTGPRPAGGPGQGGFSRPAGGAARPPYRGNPSGPRPAMNTTATTPAPHAPERDRSRDRSREYNRDSSSPRPGASGPQRPGGGGPPRPGASGPQRPGGGGNYRGGGGNHRPGGRSGGHSAQRTQERRQAPVKEKPTGPISLPPQIVVKDLAEMLGITPIEVIRDLINKHAIFASINQVVDYDKASLVAQDLGFEPSPIAAVENPAVRGERPLSANEAMMASRGEEDMVTIPPVVTIMGHVDHGKTSLLDTIRKTKVAAGEAGGITQHIGAYQVEVNGKKITFLDTPGHEAFTAMRARGAQVTHLAIIVVAADDGVMPQTREAIDHARAAKVPIIIALNKIDKANANPDRVKQQLAEIGVVIEEYGGETVCVPISARRGEGIDELLDYILLVSEVQDIKANPNRLATGVIIEARLEKNSGATATVLVQQGTLKMGDNIVVGSISGKVRAMFNDRGKRIQKATPSTPVSILGLPEVPNAGDRLEVTSDERTAKQQAESESEKRKNEATPLGQVSLDTLYMQMQEGKVKELNVVIKSDVQGSLEAIKGSLSKLGEENLKVRLIREGIGNISETDIHLAAASKAIIIGFNVKADGAAASEAQREGVDIRYYNVIYKLIEDIQAALVGMLEPTFREVIDGHAEIMQTFKSGKTVIAGCRVLDGRITRGSQVRLMRKEEKVLDGKVASLRRGKDDVREVLTGYECGILLEDFNAYEVGDIIETYSQERVAPGA